MMALAVKKSARLYESTMEKCAEYVTRVAVLIF
jgi:hypothetical protein